MCRSVRHNNKYVRWLVSFISNEEKAEVLDLDPKTRVVVVITPWSAIVKAVLLFPSPCSIHHTIGSLWSTLAMGIVRA